MNCQERLQEMAAKYRWQASCYQSLSESSIAAKQQLENADACERGARALEIVKRVAALQRIDGTFDLIDLIEQARALVHEKEPAP